MRRLFHSVIVGCISVTGVAGADLSVCAFGARSGGGTNTVAIQKAIDTCAAQGGGRVVIPKGRFLSGGLLLRSGVELHLEKEAVLEGVAGIVNYPEIQLEYSEMTYRRGYHGRRDVTGCQSIPWHALIAAEGVSHVAVTGAGEIFGNGWNFPFRCYGDRPQGLLFSRCRDVRVEGVTIRDPARWSCYFKECDGVLARGLTINAHSNSNNDGIDIESRNVLVEDCDIDTGDDAIVLKSDNPNYCVENVEVRSCRVASNCNHFKLGTASHGSFRHIRFHDCTTRLCSRPTLKRGQTAEDHLAWIRSEWPDCPSGLSAMSGIAVQNVDGGRLEDVSFENIVIEGARTPIAVRMGARRERPCGLPFGSNSVMRDICIRNVKANALTAVACSITGVPGFRPSRIVLENINLTVPGGGRAADELSPIPECEGAYPEANMFGFRLLPAKGFYIRHADKVVFSNVNCKSLRPDDRPEVVADDADFRWTDREKHDG